MASNKTDPLYCGTGVDNFHTSYKHWHGYISLIVCIVGTITNTLNIIVLSRREMRSPTNAILTGLAVADLAVMLEYIPYTIHDYILGEHLEREVQLSYSWACFIQFHSIFAQVLHTISIWLTVTLAVWRYIAVSYPQKNRIWCGMRTTIVTITTAYIVCIIVVSPSLYLVTEITEYLETIDESGKPIKSIPLTQYVIDYRNEVQRSIPNTEVNFNTSNEAVNISAMSVLTDYSENEISLISPSSNSVKSINDEVSNVATATIIPTEMSITQFEFLTSNYDFENTSDLEDFTAQYRNITVYKLFHSALALRSKCLRYATFLIYSVLIKLIPCIALTILSERLIAALLEAKRRRKKLTRNKSNDLKSLVIGSKSEKPRKNSRLLEKEIQTDRTTRMLLAVLLLFLITEFPQGIMGLLNAVLGEDFLVQCYLRLSDLMDILALLNSSINFILYCSMSKQFRSTFNLLFRPNFINEWLLVGQQDVEISATKVPESKKSVRVDNTSKSVSQANSPLGLNNICGKPTAITLTKTTVICTNQPTTTQITQL